MSMIISNVRPWGAAASDVVIDDGRISAVAPHDPTRDATGHEVVAGRNRLLVPSFSDVHVHLDSTRIGLPFRPHTGRPGVWGMMSNDRENWRDAEIDLPTRVAGTLERMIARGTTRVRSYAQVDVDCQLEKLEAVVAAKEKFADHCEVEIMAFPQAGILLEQGSEQVLEDALRHGAQVVGGIDPCTLDRDPVRHLDIVFGLAEKYQVPVDIHLHEPSHVAIFSTELIMERTKALGMQGKVTLSHAYELGGAGEATSRRIIEQLAELDISMATIAPTGRNQLSLLALADAGVRIGLGEDGQRDYWSPYGNCDLLDRTWQLAFTHGFRRDEHIEHCLAVATLGGASVMDPTGLRLGAAGGITAHAGVSVGDRADLVLLSGDTVTAAVMDRSDDRTVIHDGRVVADQLQVAGIAEPY